MVKARGRILPVIGVVLLVAFVGVNIRPMFPCLLILLFLVMVLKVFNRLLHLCMVCRLMLGYVFPSLFVVVVCYALFFHAVMCFFDIVVLLERVVFVLLPLVFAKH